MKRSVTVFLLTGLVFCSAAFVGRQAQDEDTPMTTHMKAINTGLRTLRAQMKDLEKRGGEANANILALQAEALAAKGYDPAMLKDLPEAEQAAFRVAFRKRMHTMLNTMFELEIALLEGRADDAKAAAKALLKDKSPAHKKFKADGK